MNVKEVLEAATKKLARPGGWTQRTFARDAEGKPVNIFSEQAISFCLVGAIESVDQEADGTGAIHTAKYEIAKELCTVSYNTLPSWNDETCRTQEEVVRVIRTVAAKL